MSTIETLESRTLLASVADLAKLDGHLTQAGTLNVTSLTGGADDAIVAQKMSGLAAFKEYLQAHAQGAVEFAGPGFVGFAVPNAEGAMGGRFYSTEDPNYDQFFAYNFPSGDFVAVHNGDGLPIILKPEDFSRISIDAGGGNDSIQVTANIKKPSTLLGGNGNDTLLGGSKNDYLSGGAGNDTLTARGTGAILEGGIGNDSLLGSVNASDSLFGGAGRDQLDGGDVAASTGTTVEGRKSPLGNGGLSPTPIVPIIPTVPTTPVTISGIRDYLDGGEDVDTAKRDNADVRVSIEVLT
jgi:Ca2+-binding RTX toxin-like protein